MASMGVQLQTINGDNAYPRPYYRIGDILESTNPNNPGDDGYIGTWELYGKGRVTVCIDADDSNFNIVNKEIGENKHVLTNKEMPSHTHTIDTFKSLDFNAGNVYNAYGVAYASPGVWDVYDKITQATGGGEAHNNIQKSIVVYRWRRIA